VHAFFSGITRLWMSPDGKVDRLGASKYRVTFLFDALLAPELIPLDTVNRRRINDNIAAPSASNNQQPLRLMILQRPIVIMELLRALTKNVIANFAEANASHYVLVAFAKLSSGIFVLGQSDRVSLRRGTVMGLDSLYPHFPPPPTKNLSGQGTTPLM
jgi:hypothetical protein